ncbi:MAG: hypothetical protein ABJA84_00155 [Polaromonas sp.]
MELKNTTLDDVSAVIGFSATLRLSAWYGDGASNVFIPLRAEDGQVLSNLLGIENARRLSAEWGGEHMAVPRLKDYHDGVKKRMTGKMLEKGLGTREVAECLHISARRVQQICRELEQAGLIPVQGPRKESDEGRTTANKAWARVLDDDSRRHTILRMSQMNFSEREIAGHFGIDEVTVQGIQKSLVSLGALPVSFGAKAAEKIRATGKTVLRGKTHLIGPRKPGKAAWGQDVAPLPGGFFGKPDSKIERAAPPAPGAFEG